MSYRDHLNYWAIARLLPTQQWQVVARFRSWSDAEGHLRNLHDTVPNRRFKIIFDAAEHEFMDATKQDDLLQTHS